MLSALSMDRRRTTAAYSPVQIRKSDPPAYSDTQSIRVSYGTSTCSGVTLTSAYVNPVPSLTNGYGSDTRLPAASSSAGRRYPAPAAAAPCGTPDACRMPVRNTGAPAPDSTPPPPASREQFGKKATLWCAYSPCPVIATVVVFPQ
eukprot:gene302-biopygen311